MLHARFLNAISAIEPAQWDGLFPSGNPFVRHAFLQALEQSGSVADESGWRPMHLVLEAEGQVMAVMPLYLKSHSYGEFVFDWGWAEAYRRNGLEYYPKLLTAIPFSPVAGPRIGMAPDLAPAEILSGVFSALKLLAERVHASSWHLLFPSGKLQDELAQTGLASRWLRREDVQFHWRNAGYASFDEFLGTLRSSRRKNMRRERRRVQAQGIVLRRLTGADIATSDWDGFYRCYRATYEKRSGHGGYLSRAFFVQLLDAMRDSLMLVTAKREDELVGSSLFLFDKERLYGRYWGALEAVDCLHFEACFYQGIEFSIERGLRVFDPGTQGEHKLMRGFEPVRTVSYHWLADPRFQQALSGWIEREQRGVAAYEESARGYLPYKRVPEL
jgi:predicted N-acyltransferase